MNKLDFAKSAETCGIEISPGCTNRCLFCAKEGADEIKLTDIKVQERGILKSLNSYIKKRYKKIEISGHDPLEYKLIIPLIKYIKANFEYVLISTNGVRLSQSRFRKEIISSGVGCFRIPLYGPTAKIHDSVTQIKGSFQRVIKGVRAIKKEAPDIELWIHSLVLANNQKYMKDIINMADRLGADKITISVPCISDGDYSFYIPLKDLKETMSVLSNDFKKQKNVFFLDIPYCVFGRYSKQICFSSPPQLDKNSKPPYMFKTAVENMPSYRLRAKVGICGKCRLRNGCHGFYINDLQKFGTGNLKPIL